jgi:hypothetical protein
MRVRVPPRPDGLAPPECTQAAGWWPPARDRARRLTGKTPGHKGC